MNGFQLMFTKGAEAVEAKYSKGLGEQVARLQVHAKYDGSSDINEVWHAGIMPCT